MRVLHIFRIQVFWVCDTDIFSYSVVCPFILLTEQVFYFWWGPIDLFFFLSFMGCAFIVMSKNSLPIPRSWRSLPNTKATNSDPPPVVPTLVQLTKSLQRYLDLSCVCAICQPVWNPGDGLHYESVLKDSGSGSDPWLCNLGVSPEVHTSSSSYFSKVPPLCVLRVPFPALLAKRWKFSFHTLLYTFHNWFWESLASRGYWG